MHAVRNIQLCTKDCLCLYVCPTGATDTETGQIDALKCLDGCRACVDACPSHAISLVPEEYPPQQVKNNSVKKCLLVLSESKAKQEAIAEEIMKTTGDINIKQLAKAIYSSNRLMTEDLLRESGYMLPQSQNVKDFIQSLLDTSQPEDFPKEVAEKLLVVLNPKPSKKGNTMDNNKTLDNLMAAFSGESEANRKYLAYSKKAEQDGKTNAAKLFKAASDAETIHALKHFEVANKVGTTDDNLLDAVAGETHEYKEMYPGFIETAEAEGNTAAIRSFTYAMQAEEVHARLYKEALENMDDTEEIFYYLCPVCGNIETGRPEKCIFCGVPGDKFIKY